MIVSWNWLNDYVNLDWDVGAVTDRLTMSGLNLESVAAVGDDSAIDLEVTSNRPDCLGHIGVAREISVLFGRQLKVPPAAPVAKAPPVREASSVTIACEDLCPRYVARVIRGVRIGPSPAWLRQRLQTVGISSKNNVVDVTNYVLLECGQPLHAFDFDRLDGQRIVVRQARPGENIVAIDQREYALNCEMCVIADAERPVAIGGVMGGLATEISHATVNVLIEVADFAAMSIRKTARALSLHTSSSYRFERGVDAQQMDWASRRCCELILATAGGELLEGCVFAGQSAPAERPPITLRFSQIPRILGIDVDRVEAVRILRDLGLRPHGEIANGAAQFVPPSWRRDLDREVDLIEEIARVHGYEKIAEDVIVPLAPSSRSLHDRVTARVRDTLIAAGFFEALTLSFVSDETCDLFPPQPEVPKLKVEHSSRRHENVLRQSLIPSLLLSRRENERHGNFDARLFEIASVYLDSRPGDPAAEPVKVGFVSGQSFAEMRGVVEALARSVNPSSSVSVRPHAAPQFASGRGAEVLLQGKTWGCLGEVAREVSDRIDLRDAVVVAELDLRVLKESAELIPTVAPVAKFPAVTRDLNFVLDERVTWQELETVVRVAAGPLLESVAFGGQYRGQQIAADKKSYVVTMYYRSAERTLVHEEIEQSQRAVIEACQSRLSATLR